MNSPQPPASPRPRYLKDQLLLFRLARRLAAEAAQARQTYSASPTDRVQRVLTFKSVTLKIQMNGDSPVFVLSHDSNPGEVLATLSSPAPAAMVAIECHRVHNLGLPRYEIQREPVIGKEYECLVRTDSPQEAVKAFQAVGPAFKGGSLVVWDRHDYTVAAYLKWTFLREHGKIVGWSSHKAVYADPELVAAAQLLGPTESPREGISAGEKMKL